MLDILSVGKIVPAFAGRGWMSGLHIGGQQITIYLNTDGLQKKDLKAYMSNKIVLTAEHLPGMTLVNVKSNIGKWETPWERAKVPDCELPVLPDDPKDTLSVLLVLMDKGKIVNLRGVGPSRRFAENLCASLSRQDNEAIDPAITAQAYRVYCALNPMV